MGNGNREYIDSKNYKDPSLEESLKIPDTELAFVDGQIAEINKGEEEVLTLLKAVENDTGLRLPFKEGEVLEAMGGSGDINPETGRIRYQQEAGGDLMGNASSAYAGAQLMSSAGTAMAASGSGLVACAGAGLAAAATPFALTGGVLHDLFKKKDKSQPITSDPADLVSDVTQEEQEEHIARGPVGVSEGDAKTVDLPYNALGISPTLTKSQTDYYKKGPVGFEGGKPKRGRHLGYTPPLSNPNLTSGLPEGYQLGLSTGTEKEMLEARELMSGSSGPTDDEYDRQEARLHGQLKSIYGDNPDDVDIVNIVEGIKNDPKNIKARADAKAKKSAQFKQEWDLLSNKPKVGIPTAENWYNQTYQAKLNRAKDALGDTLGQYKDAAGKALDNPMVPYGGVLQDIMNSPNAGFYGNMGQWGDALWDTGSMYKDMFRKNILGYED